jgi:hypothetical protein
MLKEQHQHGTYLNDKSALHVIKQLYFLKKNALCTILCHPLLTRKGICCLYNKKKKTGKSVSLQGHKGYTVRYIKQYAINMMSEH